MFEPKVVIKQVRVPLIFKIAAAFIALVLTAMAFTVVGAVWHGEKLQELNSRLPEKIGLLLPPGHMYAEYEEPGLVVDTDEEWAYKDLKKEVECMATNLYFEGRSESLAGQIGINLAVIARVKAERYPDTVCKVVYQKNTDRNTGKMTAQFSWTLDGKSDKIGNKELYNELYRLSEAMLAEGTLDNFHDITNGATHYHANYVKPYWAPRMDQVAVLDTHIYYR